MCRASPYTFKPHILSLGSATSAQSVSMKSWLVCLGVVCLCWAAAASGAKKDEFKLPSYVDVCYRDDPKVAECLKRDIEKLIPKFKLGSKDFDLASLDPLRFKNLVFIFQNAIIGGRLEFPDISITGLSKMKVTKVKPKVNVPQKFVLDFDGQVPVVTVRGGYKLSGIVLALPVTMDGFIDFVFDKVDMFFKLRGDAKAVGDHEFLDLKAFNTRIVGDGIKSAHIANNDVVRGRPALNRAVITALNSNWRLVMNSFFPALFPVSDVLMRDFFKSFFKKYPYDILFPKRTKAPKRGDQ